MAMTRKQELFTREYLVDMNGAAAARRAGYAEKNAASTACRLLAMPEVKLLVDRALEQRRETCRVSAEKVRASLCEIAFSDAQGQAVGHKVRCLELLAKMLGLFDSSGLMEPVTVVEDV